MVVGARAMEIRHNLSLAPVAAISALLKAGTAEVKAAAGSRESTYELNRHSAF